MKLLSGRVIIGHAALNVTGERTWPLARISVDRSWRSLGYYFALIVLAYGLLAIPQQSFAQQADQGWDAGISVSPPAQTEDAWAIDSQTEPGSSDAVQRAREALEAPQSGPGVSLAARLTDDGRTLTRDLTWRVYKIDENPETSPKLIVTKQQASPVLALEPGSYYVNVSFGRSHITRKIEVAAGPMKAETFILNAGGLRLTAYASEKKLPDTSVRFDVFEAESDQAGQRRTIISKARPGVIVRLNAGIYLIRSTYGEANAQVESEVSVEAGKLTEIAMAHAAAKVTLALVTRQGGEALPATQWEIATSDGKIIDRSVGALPTHIIAPGTYKVTASNGGRVFTREVNLEDSQIARVELLAQ